MNGDSSALFRHLPSVETILSDPMVENALSAYPRPVVVDAVRVALDGVREEIRAGLLLDASVFSRPIFYVDRIAAETERLLRPSLRRVINATGVVIHTNLGRVPLSEEVFDRAREVALRYSNLEFDLETGKRGSRYVHAEGLLRRLTGAEAALVTNNNAAAVLVSLNALARGKEVIVSRGELIEIGGSFRIPEIMEAGGAKLVEVGTTNRTGPDDYRKAITEETALLMKIHLSNFRIEGFTADVSAGEVAAIGAESGIPVLYDLGSGAFLRTDPKGEPTVIEELRRGPTVLTMSGDKLLGSVQAGIILGRKEEIDRIRKAPIMRAARVDKITLALLEATLIAYLEPAVAKTRVPVLRLILRPLSDIRKDADQLREAILSLCGGSVEAEVVEGESEAGGGAIGQPSMPTWLLRLAFAVDRPEEIASRLRELDPPVIVRVKRDRVFIDPRTLFPEEIAAVSEAIALVVTPAEENSSRPGP